eukprot:1082394-Prorocentrum_minimum.AAC.1
MVTHLRRLRLRRRLRYRRRRLGLGHLRLRLWLHLGPGLRRRLAPPGPPHVRGHVLEIAKHAAQPVGHAAARRLPRAGPDVCADSGAWPDGGPEPGQRGGRGR